MNVTVYTISGCNWCKALKEYLEEKEIPFTEINVSEKKWMLKEMVEKTGQKRVPVVDIDGNILVGFEPEKLDEALKL